jgi:enoyl-CoA hydratase
MPIHYQTIEPHIVQITIDRPEARNSLDLEHFKALREAWERLESTDEDWVAIVTGVGDSFCSGADLKTYVPAITKLAERLSEGGSLEIDGYRLDDGTRAVLRDWPLNKPIIAAVNGVCTAGGMEMLGGTDIRVASASARFAVMEPKRGLFAGGGTTVRLPRQIPWAAAMEFLLCADLIDAPRAGELGLLNMVVPAEELLDTALSYARRIVVNAPLAVQATKESALDGLYVEERIVKRLRKSVRALTQTLEERRALEASDPAGAAAIARAIEELTSLGKDLRSAFERESQISRRIFSTEDAKEGPKAFKERRDPVWQSR